MNFAPTPEQAQLRHAAREFMRRECPPEVIHRALAEGRHSAALWRPHQLPILSTASTLTATLAVAPPGLGLWTVGG